MEQPFDDFTGDVIGPHSVTSFNDGYVTKETCRETGKVCYTQAGAAAVIRKMKSGRHIARGKNIPQRSYVCQFCGNYHLTHFRKKNSTKRFSKSRMER